MKKNYFWFRVHQISFTFCLYLVSHSSHLNTDGNINVILDSLFCLKKNDNSISIEWSIDVQRYCKAVKGTCFYSESEVQSSI